MTRNDARQAGAATVTAVLGPTNTGKTHLAMERMLGHASGMIGFPLRLLARENYDRAVAIKGARHVALITGEEKILPPDARWFLCTVESMPVDRDVAFLGVDEIQMCADPDRGHLFTDRLLHARGRLETMFMGAETIKPLLRKLVPEAQFIVRPRFSRLTHAGPAKLSRLPPRSAVVSFSIADVYAIAELVRRQRGGTALVLGALSPRTRNAQVAIYQAGDVDYLVATDAIGMGLNMHVDHVAFAATRKFDGRAPRALNPAEMAQIAGRAGRHTRDGTFGTTAEVGPLDVELAERIEQHRFEALTGLQWRNSDLHFSSLEALKRSLGRYPDRPGLMRAREADDEIALGHLARESDIAALARGPEAVRQLWEVCRIPDFGKVTGEGHARLLAQIFRFLQGGAGGHAGRLPTDWVAKQVDRINRTDGDIDALMQRIANVRTWTYVSHQVNWLDDADGWQQRTRAIEDKLSDALHERLIQRFVDRRTSSLVSRLQERRDLRAIVSAAGEVLVEGHFVGTLSGFRFLPDETVCAGGPRDAARSVTAAALRALTHEARGRVDRCDADADPAFALAADGALLWQGAPVARLVAGSEALAPLIEPLASELLDGEARERVRARLQRWLRAHLRQELAPLFLGRDAMLAGAARGLLFQTSEALGSLPRRRAQPQIAALARADRRALAACGLRIGRESVYFPELLTPPSIRLRALLWRLHRRDQRALPAQLGAPSLSITDPRPAEFWESAGYRVLAGLAVRMDVLERVVARAEAAMRAGGPLAAASLARVLGCAPDLALAVVAALGYRSEPVDGGIQLLGRKRPRERAGGASDGGCNDAHPADGHSPFAALKRRSGTL